MRFKVITLTCHFGSRDLEARARSLSVKRTMPIDSQTPKTYIDHVSREFKKKEKISLSPGVGQFDYWWKAENLIRSSPYYG